MTKTTRSRSVLAAFAIFLALYLVPVMAQDTATDEDAAALLESAATAMLDLESFHFLITTPVGSTTLIDQVEIKSIEGDVLRPSAFRAEFTVELAFIELPLDAVGIGDRLWVQDPLGGGDAFVLVSGGEAGEGIPPTLILNPDQLVLQAISYLRDPVVVGGVELDGRRVTRIDGIFDPADIELEGTPVTEGILSGIDPLGVSIWLNEDLLVLRAEFTGALLPGESSEDEIVRRVDLSAFNEPIEILPPEDN